ncbi:MAG: flavodoxin FldA [Okeania sp. SIO2G4]|uniref:flavodoxin FldA n=1 Tax=unclassified Okeania TaxID=2634635 RepID=UPI0013BB416D|nr:MULTISPECIES: flavodoxin FldA [unclassified Okeania]NEP39189.1 flavodoxin FldA [Okeania sp. SIO2H7]NEP74453.1 flavodoxin FldA [Okeania sp. SIO2G5]NEP95150.1 flavodoxin FldA [Okeania sp. SIO2F5]NEQ89709.1 flavodoxin FldA [Okeania sp. SIO2G4]
MSNIGLFVGSTTGKTESVAEMVQAEFGGDDVVTIHNMDEVNTEDFDGYQNIIVASPTWNIGELQSDWEGFFDELDNIDFNGKKVAYFGTGDQIGYGDNFQDAMGILEEKISSLGGKTVGHWPTDGYEYSESKAVKDGKFIGLALDEDNQAEFTEERVKKWVAQLKIDFGI